MTKVLFLLVISLCLFFPAFSQNKSYYSSSVTVARCGSSSFGPAKQIENDIIINESDNLITIYSEDGSQALALQISSVKPSDDIYGITKYSVEPNNSGIHTVLLDVDAQRELLILLRKDNVCTFYGPLRKNK